MKTLPEKTTVVHAGLDVAKDTLQLHLQNRQHALPNTAGGFAAPGDGAQAFDELGVTFGGVGQRVLAVVEVELEGVLGDIEAGMDDGSFFRQCFHSVRTQTCIYERGVKTPAPSTVRVTDTRRERLRLSHEHAQAVPGSNERVRAGGLPLQGRGHPIFQFGGRQTSKMKNNIQGPG